MAKIAYAFGMIFLALAAIILSPAGCDDKQPDDAKPVTRESETPPVAENPAEPPLEKPPSRNYKVVHVIVALCDNENQGIVKVRAALGNGQDPKNNLYWGAMYGLRTFFRGKGGWQELENRKILHKDSSLLRRTAFRAEVDGTVVYVIADAYDGAKMVDALRTFFSMAAGRFEQCVKVPTEETPIVAGGYADMICFVGHNGLMDLPQNWLDNTPFDARPDKSRCAVVLACKSASYFTDPLKRAGGKPLVMTYGLMAPEAYTLDAIIRSWATGDAPATTRLQAAQAYAKYQKCPLSAAQRLFGAK